MEHSFLLTQRVLSRFSSFFFLALFFVVYNLELIGANAQTVSTRSNSANVLVPNRSDPSLSEGRPIDETEDEDSQQSAVGGVDSLLSAKAVQTSIEGAIAFLKKQQLESGAWKEYPSYEPGTTSLCALALLTAGLDKTDPTLEKTLAYLSRFTPERQNQTYSIALQTMVFCLADPEFYRENILANVVWLTERQMRTANEFSGGWSYVGDNPSFERADNSNSQFALLALYEAELVGIRVDERVWDFALDYWKRMQNDDGSWGYRSSTYNPEGYPSGYGTGSMTCAGIASLAICSGVRDRSRARIEGENAYCCQDVEDEIAERISRGLDWLGKHFSVRVNPGHKVGTDSYFFYYLYGLERAGRLTANRFIGRSDWYREGAEILLQRKGSLTNFWNAQRDLNGNNCISTAFALLFLSKGRWPLLVSKLERDDEDWNAHPNDIAHLTSRVEREWDVHLIWQTIDSKRSTLDDYLQTPILAISGTKSPLPRDPEERERLVQNLRGYLLQGGFIFAEAIDGDVSFETGFRELMRLVLEDEPDAELRLLEPDHPIWTMEKTVEPDLTRPLWGVDYGCRTSVVFAPAQHPQADENGNRPSVDDDRPSLSCLWEATKSLPRDDADLISEKMKREVEAAFAIGINICAYATNRRMKYKDEIAYDAGKELEKGSEIHNSLFAAVLECGAGASCAPRAIPNLMKAIRNRFGVPAQLFVPRASAKNDDIFDYPVLFMHGRNEFTFSEEERERLRLYFQRGGFLFANAVCASEAFERSFQTEARAIFPDNELLDVPADDPIFTSRYGGFKIEKLQYRTRGARDREQRSASVLEEAPPRLKGIRKDGRWIVLYSPVDVSCALENITASNCEGLSQTSAFSLAVNVLFYAAEALGDDEEN